MSETRMIPIEYVSMGKPKKRTVHAALFGPLAVHETIGESGFWTVTHMATGRALHRFIGSKASAVTIATMLQDLPGWLEISEDAIVAQTREAVTAALQKVGILVKL